MFEQILKELKTKYSKFGLSETILKVYAKKIAKAVKEESEIEEAVVNVEDDLAIYQSLSDSNRNLQKEIASLKDAKKSEPEPKGEPKGEPKQEPKQDEMPTWAKSLIESNKALSDGLNAIQTEKVNKSNSEKLTAKLKELGVSEHFYNLQVQGKTFANDEEIETFANSVKEAEDGYLQLTNNSKLSGSAGSPLGGKQGADKEVSAEFKDFMKNKYQKHETN